MIEQVRTSEDHNGDGTGVPPFPRACTEYTRSSFEDAGALLFRTHTLQEETALIAIRFEPSDKCRLYAHDALPDAEDIVWSRLPSNTTTGHSTLGGRDIVLKVTEHDPADAPPSTFDITIWEW